MESAFRFDSKVFQIVEKIVNLVKLNILWILFSIPVVTIGAANCALHDTAVKILKNQEGYIFQNFWSVFRRKFKQSFKLWIWLLFAGVGLYLDFVFWRNMEGNLAAAMSGFVAVLMGVWLVFVFYVFPLAARMETDTRTTFRNAGLLAFKHLPKSLYMLLWLGIFWISGQLWAPVLLVEMLAGGAMLAVVYGRVFLKIFEKEQVPGDI